MRSSCYLSTAKITQYLVNALWDEMAPQNTAHTLDSTQYRHISIEKITYIANLVVQFCQEHKTEYFGHIRRHNGLEKMILDGTVAGKGSSGHCKEEKDICLWNSDSDW